MVHWLLFLLPLSVLATSSRDKTLGVHPTAVSKYTPTNSNTWECLDGSEEIPWDAVNDDYCDCPDGSDEPGTSACSDNLFWCQNEDHIGAYIPSSRVGDGLCEPECCDGSDERPGVCKNLCKEMGEVYRKKRDAELKIQKTGSKIRSTYISFAHKEEKRLENLVVTLGEDITAKEKEVDRLRDIFERTESLSQASLEHKKQSPLYQSLVNHNKALESLKREHKKHVDRERELGNILDALRRGYNPNYQDMAVLEAVRGWEEMAALPHINDVKKEGEEPVADEQATPAKADEPVDDGLWSADDLEVDKLLQIDYTTLLLEHEEHIGAPMEDPLLFKITSYLPESVLPHYEALKDNFVEWLEKLGVIEESSGKRNSESTRAQQALTEATNELNQLRLEQADAEKGATQIFDVQHFGAEGEWKKLDNVCIEHNTGDYTYEVCLFNEAQQKPNNGGSNFSLGRFQSWNPSPDVEPGSPEYYQKQIYKHGTRCWNGPERSVEVILACGVENAINTVQELEKCEYQFTGTTPALCLPPNAGSGSRDEL